ncbi:bifunctional lysylphosphatidylglycerol flippase/synthetase MprF [Dietzia sp. UBA5065]|uniref:bifunctional lysylphosphatidylglycerol flippase/synthetase MprF n=1 Tax=Dietzia sp. UBA5065 TaxID=1946422 RepID=UPI0025C18735|nr:DUF2156 domain-containing protein [Dietzia sp. UBA5065]HMT48639.1 DUF2156 domain-containing protein [Dietzia sp.]
MRRAVSTARGYAARAWSTSPYTVALLAALWVLAAVTGSAVHGPDPGWAGRVAVGWTTLGQGHLWTVVTSGLFVSGVADLVVSSLLLLGVGPVAERLLGGPRMLVAALVAQVAGVVGGIGYGALFHTLSAGAGAGSGWADVVHAPPWVGPLPWILGALLASTARMPVLWRRRTRAVALAVLVTLVLFAGHPQDVVRLCAALAGLGAGIALTRDAHHTRLLGGSVRETRTLLALVVAASVLGPLVVSLTAGAVGPLAPLSQLVRDVPFTPAQTAELCAVDPGGTDCWNARQLLRLTGVGPVVLTLMPTLLVLMLADGLRRGRRAALWWARAAYAAQLVASAALLFVGPVETDRGRRQLIVGAVPHEHIFWVVAPLVVVAGTLLALLVTGGFFQTRASVRAARRAAVGIAAVVLGGSVVFVGLGALVTEGVAASGLSDPSVVELALDYPARLIPPAYLGLFGPSLLPVSDAATVLFEWIGVAVWAGVIVVLWRFLHARRTDEDPAAEHRLRELLHRPGGTSMSWMTTWRGNEYWFTQRHPPGSPSAVAFRVVGRVALTTGGPVGPEDQVGPAALEFAEHCVLQGLTPCFYSVDAALESALRAAGWSSVQVAEETVIPLPDLAFSGKRFQDVRTALNRARKEQVTAVWTTFDRAPLALVNQILAISEEWVADKALPEMGFTLGGIEELGDPEVRLLLAVDADDVVHGVTSWLPVYREGVPVGLTLDFMRRRTGGFRPTTEFLIASAALRAKEEGLEFLSLSGAPLAHGGRGDQDGGTAGDDSALSAVLDRVGAALEPVYGFRSLLAFKAKFDPRYRPLYLCHPDAAALPAIGVAVGRAYLPEVGLGQGARLVGTLGRIRLRRGWTSVHQNRV